jgi:hypothetical protein
MGSTRVQRFKAGFVELRGEFVVDGEAGAVFPLFSPKGEEAWVPGWRWEPVYPHDGEWREGQVFRTVEERGEATWVVTRLDPGVRRVQYHRVEPGRYVARVGVGCTPLPDGRTRVSTEYDFTGLSATGNADIAGMSSDAYAAKMKRWQGWIQAWLSAKR